MFLTRSRDEWTEIFAGSDACVAPVLTLAEAQDNEQLRARGAYVTVSGVPQSAPAPRFSRTPPDLPIGPQSPDADAALAGWLPPGEIARHRDAGLFA